MLLKRRSEELDPAPREWRVIAWNSPGGVALSRVKAQSQTMFTLLPVIATRAGRQFGAFHESYEPPLGEQFDSMFARPVLAKLQRMSIPSPFHAEKCAIHVGS